MEWFSNRYSRVSIRSYIPQSYLTRHYWFGFCLDNLSEERRNLVENDYFCERTRALRDFAAHNTMNSNDFVLDLCVQFSEMSEWRTEVFKEIIPLLRWNKVSIGGGDLNPAYWSLLITAIIRQSNAGHPLQSFSISMDPINRVALDALIRLLRAGAVRGSLSIFYCDVDSQVVFDEILDALADGATTASNDEDHDDSTGLRCLSLFATREPHLVCELVVFSSRSAGALARSGLRELSLRVPRFFTDDFMEGLMQSLRINTTLKVLELGCTYSCDRPDMEWVVAFLRPVLKYFNCTLEVFKFQGKSSPELDALMERNALLGRVELLEHSFFGTDAAWMYDFIGTRNLEAFVQAVTTTPVTDGHLQRSSSSTIINTPETVQPNATPSLPPDSCCIL